MRTHTVHKECADSGKAVECDVCRSSEKYAWRARRHKSYKACACGIRQDCLGRGMRGQIAGFAGTLRTTGGVTSLCSGHAKSASGQHVDVSRSVGEHTTCEDCTR